MKTLGLILALAVAASGQTATTKSKPKTTKAKRPAAATPATAPKPAEPPTAVLDTSMGQISCVLFPDKAPKTVANFIGLAHGTREWTNPNTGAKNNGKPLFDGTIFHRVIPNFMIQGGDPQGTGMGGPGYRFEDEFDPSLRFDKPGRLAMANSGPATNGSQFFITEVPTPHLDDRHTIFGQCDEPSVEIVRTIARVAADPRNNRPVKPVTLNKVTILGVEQPKKPRATRLKTKAKTTPK
jgi:peptidyl-prolyl cis-trans isomerase A (cyclophilin A)